MSGARHDELAAAVYDRLVACPPTEALGVLAEFAGAVLALAPGPQRDMARALFMALVDRCVADRGPKQSLRST